MAEMKPGHEGHCGMIPHLVIRDAAKAIEFYKKAFGAVEQMRMPMPDGKIMHACLKIGDSSFFLADEFPDAGGYKSPLTLGGTSVTLNLNVADADAVFAQAVAAGAKVQMPLADMFWGDRYGVLVDPFGHQWAVATHKEDVSPEEMKKRGQAMFAETAKEKH